MSPRLLSILLALLAAAAAAAVPRDVPGIRRAAPPSPAVAGRESRELVVAGAGASVPVSRSLYVTEEGCKGELFLRFFALPCRAGPPWALNCRPRVSFSWRRVKR